MSTGKGHSKDSDSARPFRISMRDIAERLNVSKATVSRALRNSPEISKKLCKRVQAVAAELGYTPDPMLAALVQYRQGRAVKPVTAELAWINCWPDPKKLRSFHEFDLYWQGAAKEALHAGYHLEEFLVNATISVQRLEEILLARGIKGLLIPPQGNDIDWRGFKCDHFSVVRFGYAFPNPKAHIVTSDQMTDGLLACQSTWERGYQRIGLVTRPLSSTRFSAGYMQAHLLTRQQLPPPPLLIEEEDHQSTRQKLNQWLDQVKPDAILTDSAFLRRWLVECGYRVPEDIALATFTVLDGNIDAGIDQNSEEIGRAAMQMLISLINHHERGIPAIRRELLVEGKWVDGRTLPRRA